MKTQSRNTNGGPRHGPGRRLDETRDPVILQAVLEGLAEVGYDKLTMDMVALRAHAGKGALYRRWSSKAELVISAITARHETLDVPDTGSLRGDFEALLHAISGLEDDELMRSVFTGLATAASRDVELAAAFRSQIVDGRKGALEQMLQRAAIRGEISAERDYRLILDIIPAFVFSQAVLGPETVSAEMLHRVITEIIYPLVASPPSSQWAAPPISHTVQDPSDRGGS
jgi:AcrR family transcriptional regulator